MPRRKLTPTQKKNIERTSWTADELVKADLPEVEYLIPKYLPEGLITLGGRPFAGKSFLSLQKGIAVATGGFFLNERALTGRVLYISAEDAVWGFKSRLVGQHFTTSGGRLEVELSWPRFKEGGMKKLEDRLKSKEYDFCVLDSFYKFLSGSKRERDGEIEPIATKLHNFYKTGVVRTIELLAHLNKLAVTEDMGEAGLMGDTALSAVSDTFMIINKKGEHSFLSGGGRYLGSFVEEIKFDPLTFCWHLHDPSKQIKAGSVRSEMTQLAKDKREPMSANMMANALNKNASLIRREAHSLVEQGHFASAGIMGVNKEEFFVLAEDDGTEELIASPLDFLKIKQ